MTLFHAVFYEPGHFHAALTLRTPNPRLAPDIHVYATPGPERQAFVTLVERFNTRAEQPTHWRLHLHEGPQLLQRLVADGHGDFVVLAGRNNTKLETMAFLIQAGLHVLADKPWLTDSRQLPYLTQVTAGPRLAMDLMTVRHSVRARLIAQVVHTPELFGTFVTQESPAPAIDIASVHHLYKRVHGRPLQRPAWYYDTTVQGDGVVDVQSHMVEQVQWWMLGDAEGDYERDIVLDSVRCWTTPVPLALFHESTGLDAYPEALQSSVRDGVLQYACNSEIRYRLRGISVRQTAEWRQREPEGGGDLHRLTIRGSRCHVLVRQDEETGYQAMLSLVPAAGVALESILPPVLAQWQEHFPGLVSEPSSRGVCLRLPPALDLGHEHQFALVLNTFLDHLDRSTWPQALPARIRLRYTLLAQAQDLGRRQRQGASS
jgi:predicted dehydrogenase